jgi:hypothetical protein
VVLIALTVLAIILTAGAMLAVVAAYATLAAGGFTAAATAAFVTGATHLLVGSTIAGLAVGTGMAIGAAATGHDPGQAFVQGFAGGFGPAAFGYGLRLFRSVQGATAQSTAGAAAEGATAPEAANQPRTQIGQLSPKAPSDPLELQSLGYRVVHDRPLANTVGGGRQVPFETPQGMRGVYHAGHLADAATCRGTGPHLSPHYHFYGPKGLKATVVPGDPIPWWFK